MQRMFCPQCGLHQPSEHIFCVRCGRSLPTHLLGDPPAKRVRFFAGMKIDQRDPEGAFLRVSCYRKDQHISTEDGTVVVPGRHVRFSIWVGDRARCVLSIPESEGVELLRFLEAELDDADDAVSAQG